MMRAAIEGGGDSARVHVVPEEDPGHWINNEISGSPHLDSSYLVLLNMCLQWEFNRYP